MVRTLTLAVVLASTLSGSVAAQDGVGATRPNSLIGSWTASLENDTFIQPWLPPFFLESHDRQYTNGLHAVLDRDGDAPWLFGLPMDWGRRICGPILCSRAEDRSVEYLVRGRVAQTAHTPDTLESFTVYQGERPYAGLAFGELELQFLDSLPSGVIRMSSFGALVGVWGQLSLAETAQAGFHTIQGHRDPKGWETTQDFGLALQATYRTRWSMRTYDAPDFSGQ